MWCKEILATEKWADNSIWWSHCEEIDTSVLNATSEIWRKDDEFSGEIFVW